MQRKTIKMRLWTMRKHGAKEEQKKELPDRCRASRQLKTKTFDASHELSGARIVAFSLSLEQQHMYLSCEP